MANSGQRVRTLSREKGPADGLKTGPARISERRAAEAPSRSLDAFGLRCVDNSRSELGSVPRLVHDTLQSPGRPLAPEVRTAMESGFGHDFSRVRVHADEKAAAAALSVGALAYAHGRDVVFGRGQYRPQTEAGRDLLAHELGHLVEHGGSVPYIARALPATAAPGEAAVKTALEGNDDDVRALTESPVWPTITLFPAAAAQLIIHLLSGFTGDDDEIAGLQVLQKMLDNAALDATLKQLRSRGEFESLLDDYHGEEYQQLLDLLSQSLKDTTIKAAFLDYFIGLWWVKEPEEKAIVVLLDLASPPERYRLLAENNRDSELRSAIDNEEYARQFEKILKDVLLTKGEEAQTELIQTIFTIEHAKGVTGKRSEPEIKALIKAATEDLASELLEYRMRLEGAVYSENSSSSDIAAINIEFKKRLGELVREKSVEFGIELKYNLEFNRSLDTLYEKQWASDELDVMDNQILSRIPADILHANPSFKKFFRERENPDYSGQAAPWQNRITLAGELGLSTTIHELGHMVHFDLEELLKEFKTKSLWEPLTRGFFTGPLEELLPALDDDRRNKKKDKGHQHGSYFYVYDRYEDDLAGLSYYRYSADAPFVSEYARTHPWEDFAETFKMYFINRKSLRQTCPEKYDFMHEKVWVEYRFKKHLDAEWPKVVADSGAPLLWPRTLEDFDDASPFAKGIRDKFINPVKAAAEKDLLRGSDKTLDPAGPGGIEKRTDPYISRLRRLIKSLSVPKQRLDEFVTLIGGGQLASFRTTAYDAFVDGLLSAFEIELLALVQPFAQAMIQGDGVEKTNWPELAPLVEKYRQSFESMKGYSDYYHWISIGKQSRPAEAGLAELEYHPDSPPEELTQYIDDEFLKLVARLQGVEEDLNARVKAGIPFKASVIQDPHKLVEDFRTKIQAFKRRLKKKK